MKRAERRFGELHLICPFQKIPPFMSSTNVKSIQITILKNPTMIEVAWLVVLGVLTKASFSTALPLTMSANPNAYSEKNADGSRSPLIRLLGRGETGGYNATVEVTTEGFTVKKVNGNYMYMELDERSRTIVSSGLVAGRDNPHKVKSKTSGKILSMNEHASLPDMRKVHVHYETEQRRLIAGIEEANGIPNQHSHVARRRAAATGNKKNLMIPFKFSNHGSRVVPSTADLTVLMNNVGPHALCPTGSVRDVYLASSFNQLILDTTVVPWVTLPNTESYYAAGNSGLSTTAHTMIKDALNALQATGFNFSPFDTNNDGYIDAIGFLHSGYGAEWGGSDAYGTNYVNRIWSHKWALYSLSGGKWTSSSGKSVYDYHVSPSMWGTSGSAIGRIGVIAHETGHFFGLPDLYDGSGGSGIGSYCLMSNSWGFDNSQYYPPHASAWSKIQLGWVTPTVIKAAGTYTARKACAFPDVFQISKNFPVGEYLLIENRQKCNFDAVIPGPGLAIFHIDDTASYTTEGYPGQSGWPTNGNHYRVSLLQADGAYNLEKGSNRGDSTDLFFLGGVNSITSTGTSSGAAYPNTKAYKGGTILDTALSITKIGASSDSMSFVVIFGAVPPTPAPVMPPANQFALNLLTDAYASVDNAWALYKISTNPPSLIASRAIGFYDNNLPYTETYTLADGKYQFNLTDAYGDGIISPGYYTISLGGLVLRNGASFAFFDLTTFNVGTSPVAKPAPPQTVVKPTAVQPIVKPAPVKPAAKPAPVKPTPVKPAPKPVKHTAVPVKMPSKKPSTNPSRKPSTKPTAARSAAPSKVPSSFPSSPPTGCTCSFSMQNNSPNVTIQVTISGNIVALSPGDNTIFDRVCKGDALELDALYVH